MAETKHELDAISCFNRLRESGEFVQGWAVLCHPPSSLLAEQEFPIRRIDSINIATIQKAPVKGIFHFKIWIEQLSPHKDNILAYLRSEEAQEIPSLQLLETWCSLMAGNFDGPSGASMPAIEMRLIERITSCPNTPSWMALLEELDQGIRIYYSTRNPSDSKSSDSGIPHLQLHVRWQLLRMQHFDRYAEPVTNSRLDAFSTIYIPQCGKLQVASLDYRLSFAIYAYQFAEARIARFGMCDALARNCLENAYRALGLENENDLAKLNGPAAYLAYLITKGLNVECYRHVAQNLKPKWPPELFLYLAREVRSYHGIPELKQNITMPTLPPVKQHEMFPASLIPIDTRQNLYTFVDNRAISPKRLFGWAMGIIGVAMILGASFIPASTLLLALVGLCVAIAGVMLLIAGYVQARYYRDELNSPAARQLRSDISLMSWNVAQLTPNSLDTPKSVPPVWNNAPSFWSSSSSREMQLFPPCPPVQTVLRPAPTVST